MSELLDRLKLLQPRDGDVFVLEVPEERFGEDGPDEEIQEFATAVHEVTGRDVFVIVEGYRLAAVADPRTAA